MKRCEKCGMRVRGSSQICPLCQNKLVGDAEPALFPMLPTIFSQFRMFFKLMIFATIVDGVVCVAVNMMLPENGPWAAFVVFGTCCFWFAVAMAMRRRRNMPKNITNQVVLLSLLSVLWDYITGWRGWSIDFVIPILCSAAMITLATIARILKLPPGEYIMSLLADVLFGIVPLIFYLTGTLSVQLPSIISISLSIIFLSMIILFEGRNMGREIAKRFHL